MVSEVHSGVTIERCKRCSGFWFDAGELDRFLKPILPASGTPPEARVPDRGLTARQCPRCLRAMRTAGWDGLILDRCTQCHGLYVEWREWQELQRTEAPYHAAAFETQLKDFMIDAGWTLSTLGGLAKFLMLVLRR